MSFTRVQGREEAATEETSSHHALSAAYALGYPFQVLTWGKSKFKLNMLQELKSVAVKDVKTCAGGLYEIIQLFLLHPGCRSWPSAFQSALTIIQSRRFAVYAVAARLASTRRCNHS